MVKKITTILLSTLLIFTALYPAVSVAYAKTDKEYFDDGSYVTITYYKPPAETTDDESVWEDIDSVEEGASTPSALTRLIHWLKDIFEKLFAKQSTVTKTKYCNYFDSDGKLLWSVSLKATFTYNHRKAVCVSSEITYEIRDADWKMLSYISSENGNSATGSFAIRQHKLGVPLKLIEKTLTLICDKEGNVT